MQAPGADVSCRTTSTYEKDRKKIVNTWICAVYVLEGSLTTHVLDNQWHSRCHRRLVSVYGCRNRLMAAPTRGWRLGYVRRRQAKCYNNVDQF